MKRLVLSFTVFMFVLQLAAQDFTLKGTITDESGEPLVGTSVQIKNTFLGATSDASGLYEFRNLDESDYVLVFSFLGYEQQEQTIELKKDLVLNIKLKANTLMSEEVIIKATRIGVNEPGAATTMSKDDIKKMNVQADIPYQLELTPSLVASSESGTGIGYSSFRIRGTEMSRINITVNGVPLNDGESQGVYFVNMPDFSSSVNSIQIQRGVGTSTNGVASFGGSVNFQTLTLEPKPYAQVSSSVGSFNTFKENIAVGTGLINDKFTFDVRASKLNSDGYINRGFSDHQSVYLSGSYFGKKDMLKAIAIIGKQKTGITWWGVPSDKIEDERTFNPAGEYVDKNGETQFYDGQTDNYWQNHYQLLYSREINKNINFNAVLHATTGKGYYQQYKTGQDFADYGLTPDTINTSSDLIRQKWLDNVFYGGTANINYHKGNIDAVLGVAANKYDGDHFGNIVWAQYNNGVPNNHEWYNNTGSKTDLNSFLKMSYALTEQLSLFGDIQVRNINYSIDGLDDDRVALDQTNDWTFINPKAGVNYQIDKQQRAYFSFAIANREPSRADLKEALKDGGKEFPTHETLNDFELGYQIKHQRFAVGLNAFYMLYQNQLVNTGELTSVGYPMMTNVDNSYRAGIELTWGAQIIKHIKWEGNFTYSMNKIQDYVEYAWHADGYLPIELGETDISYSPELVGASKITIDFTDGWNAFFVTKYVGEQYFDNTSDEVRKLDAYLVNNIGLDYSHKLKNGPIVNLQFVVNNVLDEEYISNAYGGNWYENEDGKEVEKSWMYYYPQAGRNFMVKLALTF